MSLTLTTAASGVARTAHYIVPTGQTQPIQTLLLEPQRTNLCIRSEEFDTWSTFTSGACTPNTAVAPDLTVTGDTITSGVIGGGVFRNVTFTGDGEKCAAVYLRAGTSARSQVAIRDGTTATDRHRVRVTWTAGVPTLTTESGAGTIYPVLALANGWYRILFSATGVIAANSNNVQVVADSVGTGTVFAWGAQVENAIVPSSYIKTEGTTVTRNADSLYFPFTAAPQAMTVYVRGVQLARTTSVPSTWWLWGIGASNGSLTPRAGVFLSTNAYSFFYENTVQSTSGAFGASAVCGDLIELNAQIAANGQNRLGGSLNGGTETLSAFTGSQAVANAWADQRLWINSIGTQAGVQFAFTHLVIAAGEQTMATMRQLAGVV